ncbi:hypothetical protein [Micropruina sp.]|uniref:hypothetical protein n=1 Tax=Micropruina sp. TaxID=2737536 RepID=UPI0039E48260
MNPPDADDTRFDELMALEFPEGLVPTDPGPSPPHGNPAGAPRPTPPSADPVTNEDPAHEPDDPAPTGFRRWVPPEEPDEPFVPPPAPPAGRWTPAGISAAVLVVLPVLLVLLSAVGVRLPTFVSGLAGLGFVIGVVLMLHRLRKRPPVDGDGAVV